MEEEKKREETQVTEPTEGKSGSGAAKTVLKIILGIVLVIGGIGLLVWFWSSFLVMLKACIGPFLILAGAITIALAKE